MGPKSAGAFELPCEVRSYCLQELKTPKEQPLASIPPASLQDKRMKVKTWLLWLPFILEGETAVNADAMHLSLPSSKAAALLSLEL